MKPSKTMLSLLFFTAGGTTLYWILEQFKFDLRHIHTIGTSLRHPVM